MEYETYRHNFTCCFMQIYDIMYIYCIAMLDALQFQGHSHAYAAYAIMRSLHNEAKQALSASHAAYFACKLYVRTVHTLPNIHRLSKCNYRGT